MTGSTAMAAPASEHEDILDALQAAGERVTDAEIARRAAIANIGVLLRRGRALHAAHSAGFPRLEVTEAQDRTGLSRPTLYKAMAAVPDDSGPDPRAWSNTYLAQAHAGYGYGGHEVIDSEFWRRYPHLAGWRAAIRFLTRREIEEWSQSHPGLDPLGLPGPDPDPAIRTLIEGYRAAVDAMAICSSEREQAAQS